MTAIMVRGCSAWRCCSPSGRRPGRNRRGRWATDRPASEESAFGKTGDGTPVEAFTLTNKAGVEVKAISYGAIITSIRVPDRTGAMADVALGFDTLDGYLKEHPYFGAVVGRYGNRIGKARFTLDGQTYKLAANNGPNHLHGGVRGFDKYVWKAEVLEGRDRRRVHPHQPRRGGGLSGDGCRCG